ncbi:PREDICTED: agamous-like MADS-box protein AGL29 [Camelina sativa]|uniref:Agamous-like MADS-box protein AGL29 n=1 Tax=Camelina sativa TaxID=90675 RepID=A0ABM0VT85_CAMSA|nr:PREDICTED: agamous-like MADS-box protein AGL29 [Camelina sativa]
MSSKKTKGKQRIKIKKIEKDEDRLVALSKRRNGIYTKLSELAILCGAHFAFLGYSASGKPYTFGSPSFQAVVERFLNGEASSSSSSSLQRSFFDAHHKAKIQELCELYNSLVDKAREEEAEEMKAAASVEPLPEDAWWKVDPMAVTDEEERKQLLEKFEGLYEKLCDEVDVRNQRGDAAAEN